MRGLVGNERAAFYLAALGLLIKLYVIDRLCKSKVLALMLLVPLVYVQYDFTQFRTGFAISWYFLGIYFLVRRWFAASVPVVGTCFLWHMQALPSISLFPAYWLNRSNLVAPIVILSVLCLLALGVYPKAHFLVSAYTPGIGAERYIASSLSGEFDNVKALPLGYIPILIGAAFILTQSGRPKGLFRAVGSSIIVGTILAWFFSANPAIQGRMFEFYMAPLVLVVGNISDNTLKKATVLALSWILYLRLELFNDWILG